MTNNTISRRQFIKGATGALVATTALSSALAINAEASSAKPPLPMQPVKLDLATTEYAPLLKVGQAVKVPNPHDKKRPIIVTRISDTTVTAYSSKCTHFGCEISLPQNNSASCPCHGSKFDMSTGKPTHGPAHKGLFSFFAVLEGNTITIQDPLS